MRRRMYQIVGVIVVSGLLVIPAGCSLQISPITNVADLSKVDFSNSTTLKESEACATYILGIIGPIGDPSLMAAIRKGNLKTVKTVDYKSNWYLLFSQSCVVVYGE